MNTCKEKIMNTFKELIENKLIVPSYQRAYSWQEKQLEQFINDMLEVKDKSGYYYGHFILEKKDEKTYEIIDGQQRVTTFILFLIICKLYNENKNINIEFDKYINNFQTVDYDEEIYALTLKNINKNEINIKETTENKKLTLSIQRVKFALEYFKKLFNKNEKINKEEISNYINVFLNAEISTHIAKRKAVAVQIFELQNTRGVKLNLIEKVKSKLMKALYLNSENNVKVENEIKQVQDYFSEIYKLEELVSSNSFRGEITLDEILFYHLRMVDDGTKLFSQQNLFNEPWGNREDVILKYLDDKINKKEKVREYVLKLSELYKETVVFICDKLPTFDKENRLIGDVLILDRALSLQFFILLLHKGYLESIKNNHILRLWQLFLYTRDFHSKYYNTDKDNRDRFHDFYFEISKILNEDELKSILIRYNHAGFRSDRMLNRNLNLTVEAFLKDKIVENTILNNVFNWNRHKINYILYKYEISKNANIDMLRDIYKKGVSLEHILPQDWEGNWLPKEKNEDEKKALMNKVNSVLNGIGNLLPISKSENSSESNKHPNVKNYECCTGGSYDEHNKNKNKWDNPNNWENNIMERGKEIYEFLLKFVKEDYEKYCK